MANTAAVTNVAATGTGDGGDLLEKREGVDIDETEVSSRRSW